MSTTKSEAGSDSEDTELDKQPEAEVVTAAFCSFSFLLCTVAIHSTPHLLLCAAAGALGCHSGLETATQGE